MSIGCIDDILLRMDQFEVGQVIRHKATLDRCVIIKINENGTIKVRDQNNKEQDYYPQELRPEIKTTGIVHRRGGLY